MMHKRRARVIEQMRIIHAQHVSLTTAAAGE
jgi:hypothetical protein